MQNGIRNGAPTPGHGVMANKVIGIIGMGDMGKMYARRIGAAGWRYVNSEPRQSLFV